MPVYNSTGSQRTVGIGALEIRSGSQLLVNPNAQFVTFTGTAVTAVEKSGDGVNLTLTAGAGGGGVQFTEGSPSPRIRTTASLHVGTGTNFAETYGTNVFFAVSGSIGNVSTYSPTLSKVALFHDAVFSGSIGFVSNSNGSPTPGVYWRASAVPGNDASLFTILGLDSEPELWMVNFKGDIIIGAEGTSKAVIVYGGPLEVELGNDGGFSVDTIGTRPQSKGANTHFYVSGTHITSSAGYVAVFGGATHFSSSIIVKNVLAPSASYVDFFHSNPQAADISSTRMYGTARANRSLISIVGPGAQDTPLQPALFGNAITYFGPFGNLSTSSWGCSYIGTGVISHTTMSTAILNLAYSGAAAPVRKVRYVSANVLGNGAGVRTQDPFAWRGQIAGEGGWFMHARFTIPFNVPSRAFIGLMSNTGGMVGWREDISGTVNTSNNAHFIGIGWDRLDPLTGCWRVMRKDATNYISEQIPNMLRRETTGSLIDFICFCAPGNTGVNVQVKELKYTGSNNGLALNLSRINTFYSMSIPATTTPVYPQAGVFNHTGAHGLVIDINRIYTETDL